MAHEQLGVSRADSTDLKSRSNEQVTRRTVAAFEFYTAD